MMMTRIMMMMMKRMMAMFQVRDQNQEEDIREAFRVFDNVSPFLPGCSDMDSKDGNGFIDRRELALMMRFSGEAVSDVEIEVGGKVEEEREGEEKAARENMAEEESGCLQEIIKEADVDMNGLIDYTEFFNLMSPKC